MTPFVEKTLFREAILKPGSFQYNYDLKCYEPHDDLKPFVEHYFISRRRAQYDPLYVGSDVLSQPVVSLFFKPEGAHFEGPTMGKRTLAAKDSPLYVGAQFKPGGFYPFWKQPLNSLAEKRIPASSVIPAVTKKFVHEFLEEDDHTMLSSIESLLRSKDPQPDPNLELLDNIIRTIEESNSIVTVAKVAAQFNKSERTVQHLFQTYVGVGAKWTIMRTRFLEVIKHAREQEKPDWLWLASEYGYSDQSHFINDFKRLTGESPSQFVHNMPAPSILKTSSD